MAYEINEARKLVVEAGKKLVETGLIARTWGNVSARISDTQFIITPSGRAYETLTEEELVVVNIEDCEYEGDIKPSSEKGVHADAYRLRPDVDFVIHTHQVNASALSPTGREINKIASKAAIKVLGPKVPVADYGMPSTGTLRKAVAASIEANPECKAFIMKHHGALCLGKDYDESFKVAETLEDVCNKEIGKAIQKAYGTNIGGAKLYKVFEDKFSKTNNKVVDLGRSQRISDKTFEFYTKDGKMYQCNVDSAAPYFGIGPREIAIHANIYKNSDVKYIEQCIDKNVVALSKAGIKMMPHLDDFAQIAGTSVKCCNWENTSYRTDAKEIGKASKGRNAILVKGQGALCTGNSTFDVEGVKKVLEKECKAEMYCKLTVSESPLSPIDTNVMRVIYNLKYSKQASK